MKKVNVESDFKMERRFEMVDLDRQAEMNRVSANIHYQIAKNFTEQDAEATIRAIVDTYPGIVMKVLSKKYIRNLATIETLGSVIKNWSEEI